MNIDDLYEINVTRSVQGVTRFAHFSPRPRAPRRGHADAPLLGGCLPPLPLPPRARASRPRVATCCRARRPSAAGCRGDVVGAHRPRPARLLRRLCALSRGSGAGVCAAGGHGGPSPSSWASSGGSSDGSSDGTPSARTRSNARDPPTEPARRRMPVLSSLPSGDPFVPCWCWQAPAAATFNSPRTRRALASSPADKPKGLYRCASELAPSPSRRISKIGAGAHPRGASRRR